MSLPVLLVVALSEAMIAAVRDRCGDAFYLHLADAAALPFPDACFDVVLSFRLHGDRRVGQPLVEAGFVAEIRAERWGERIAVGTKPGSCRPGA